MGVITLRRDVWSYPSSIISCAPGMAAALLGDQR